MRYRSSNCVVIVDDVEARGGSGGGTFSFPGLWEIILVSFLLPALIS